MDNRLKDKWWRLTHLYKIKNKQGQIVTFKPNYIQLKHLDERRNHKRNLIVKYRQGGVTTLYCIDYLDEALWVTGMSCAILGHERQAITKIFEIVKRAYDYLPADLKPETRTDTKNSYFFTKRYDGSLLDSEIYVGLKLRSGTVKKLHITESAYIKDRQELIAGSKQAVPKDGYISEETTGNGFNEFYDDYTYYDTKPNPDEMDYKTYFYAWHEDPEYTLDGKIDEYTADELALIEMVQKEYGYRLSDGQLLWRRWKKEELRKNQEGVGLSGTQLFMQEYPSTKLEAFQSGQGQVFDPYKLNAILPKTPLSALDVNRILTVDWETKTEAEQKLIHEYIKKIQGFMQKGVKFYTLPEADQQYTIGVDPSDGQGSDNSCIDVWLDTKQVAQFYGKMRPDELAELTAELGTLYNKAFVGIENNMLTTILFFVKIYDNYYFEVKIDERTQARTKKIGWNTNSKTRDVMIDEFIKFFEEDELDIASALTLGEMKTFVRKENGKREHADGKHDDSTIAAMIAIQMRKYNKPTVRTFARKAF